MLHGMDKAPPHPASTMLHRFRIQGWHCKKLSLVAWFSKYASRSHGWWWHGRADASLGFDLIQSIFEQHYHSVHLWLIWSVGFFHGLGWGNLGWDRNLLARERRWLRWENLPKNWGFIFRKIKILTNRKTKYQVRLETWRTFLSPSNNYGPRQSQGKSSAVHPVWLPRGMDN